jgi:hypothetical protein
MKSAILPESDIISVRKKKGASAPLSESSIDR